MEEQFKGLSTTAHLDYLVYMLLGPERYGLLKSY